MTADRLAKNLLVAVGSRHDRVCSIGAFARAEAAALRSVFQRVELLEPDQADRYPVISKDSHPDVIFFHAPALHDRKRPWNALLSAFKLKLAFPRAKFVSIVHELFEAPRHWQIRQALLLKLSHGVIVNTEPDWKIASRYHSNVLKSQLGPTLFFSDLIAHPDAGAVSEARASARKALAERFSLPAAQKWIVHPGLLTPGKGINFLTRFAPFLPKEALLIIMGGQGPKERDRQFARQTLSKLEQTMDGRMKFIDSPDDENFKELLIGCDLVLLPYDAGLSERRSSFLSAMCCGANVWTTVSALSRPLAIENTGVHRVELEEWNRASDEGLSSVAQALLEDEKAMLARRVKNLMWARSHTWDHRALKTRDYINRL